MGVVIQRLWRRGGGILTEEYFRGVERVSVDSAMPQRPTSKLRYPIQIQETADTTDVHFLMRYADGLYVEPPQNDVPEPPGLIKSSLSDTVSVSGVRCCPHT